MHNNMQHYTHNPYQDTASFNDNYSFPTNALFNEHEQKALQNFLDGFEKDDDLDMGDVHQQHPQHMNNIYPTSYSTQQQQQQYAVRNTYAPTSALIPTGRPTPVMLSSPTSLNSSYPAQQHFSTVPLSHPSPLSDHLSTSPLPPTQTSEKRNPTAKSKPSRKASKPYSAPEPAIKTEPISGSLPTPTRVPSVPKPKPSRRKSQPASQSPAGSASPQPQGEADEDAGSGDDKSPSSSATTSRGGRGKKPPHELLTEAEKKANHIASEQKRRQNIRVGFDQLVDIVPTLSQCHRSEALILQKSVEYIRQLLLQKDDLKERVRDLQGVLGDASLEEDSSEGELDFAY